MKNAIKPATDKAATMGTARIKELPSTPPSASERAVVGSRVATDSMLDDESIELVIMSDGAIISCCGQCPVVHVLVPRVEASSFDVA